MYTSTTLVYNPACGKKSGAGLAQKFCAAFKSRYPHINLTSFASSSSEHLAALVAQHYTKENLLIIMGGDGTFSLGLTALFAQNNNLAQLAYPIALLPAGSGNSFLREFGIDNFALAQDKLFAALDSGKPIRQDCAKFAYSYEGKNQNRHFINIWAIGLISDINLLAGKLRKAYTLATLLKIPTHKMYEYKILADGMPKNLKVNFISVSNSKYTGGAMLMAPMANTADGLLDAIIPTIPGRLGLLGLFPKIFKGEHIQSPHIQHFAFKSLKIDLSASAPVMVDGEMVLADSISLEVMPDSWKLWV